MGKRVCSVQQEKAKKEFEKGEMKTVYDLMFDRLDKSRKESKDGGGGDGRSITA
jgi:hypothetical protein